MSAAAPRGLVLRTAVLALVFVACCALVGLSLWSKHQRREAAAAITEHATARPPTLHVRSAFERLGYRFESKRTADGVERLDAMEDLPAITIIGTGLVDRIVVGGSPNTEGVFKAYTAQLDSAFPVDPSEARAWWLNQLDEVDKNGAADREASFSLNGRTLTMHWLAGTKLLLLTIDFAKK